MNKVIIIRGPLGVGKTTVAKKLTSEFDALYLSVDEILDEHNLDGDDGISVENFLKVNEILFETIKSSNKVAIIDGNFYYQEQIDDMKNKFVNDLVIITLISDLETCLKRDSLREKSYGEDATCFMYMMTNRIKEGIEIDTTDLSFDETGDKIRGYVEIN